RRRRDRAARPLRSRLYAHAHPRARPRSPDGRASRGPITSRHSPRSHRPRSPHLRKELPMTRWMVMFSILWSCMAAQSEAAVTAAAGYAVRSIPTPGTVEGGVVRSGAAIIVGQGAFGVGGESIVRFTEGGAAVTIASGFNSLGGFDLGADGTLYVVDNGGDLAGAASGDTLYAIPDALTRTTALAAADAEVGASGSVPSAQDIARAGHRTLDASDARGPGAGRVVTVVSSTLAPFATALDYTAGVALDGAGGLLVGNVDASFAGALLRYPLDGSAPPTPLASGLSGVYAVVLDGAGAVLLSGGFTTDFSSSTVIAVDLAPPHDVHERAHGFGFSSDVFQDTERDETLVL